VNLPHKFNFRFTWHSVARSQPLFFLLRATYARRCGSRCTQVRCKSETSSGVRVATGHQIPYEWTYITLGCFLRALTMTDRPRKDTDLSLFVGPYQPRSSSCIPSPPLPRSRSGHRILSGGSQQKRLSYLDSISVKFGQWNGLTGDCRRIWCWGESTFDPREFLVADTWLAQLCYNNEKVKRSSDSFNSKIRLTLCQN